MHIPFEVHHQELMTQDLAENFWEAGGNITVSQVSQ